MILITKAKKRVQLIKTKNEKMYVQDVDDKECVRYWIRPDQILGITITKNLTLYVTVTGALEKTDVRRSPTPTS